MTGFAHRAPLSMLISNLAPLATALAMTLAAGGCQTHRLGEVPFAFADKHEAGIAVIGQETYHLSALTKTHTDGPVLFTLKSNERRVYDGKAVYPDFRAYVNPNTPRGSPVDIHVDFTQPLVQLFSGWTYLVGTSPMGKTTRVRAVGVGTQIILEIDDSVTPPVHRVYFVGEKSSKVEVYAPPDDATPKLTMTVVGTYVEVYDSGPPKDMGAYASNPDRAKFVAMVLGETTSKGVH